MHERLAIDDLMGQARETSGGSAANTMAGVAALGGRAGFVTLISNFQPDQSPGNGPNYYTMDPNALYEIHIDSNGDAVEDLTYQFQFKNFLQNGTGRKADQYQRPVPGFPTQRSSVACGRQSALLTRRRARRASWQ